MRGSSIAAGTIFAAAANAALPDGVVQFDVGRRQPYPKLGRRATANTDSTSISNDATEGGYFATCKIGTPAQTLTLQLDTGSSDIWVPSSSASVCRTTRESDGCSYGSCMFSLSPSLFLSLEFSFSNGLLTLDTSQLGRVVNICHHRRGRVQHCLRRRQPLRRQLLQRCLLHWRQHRHKYDHGPWREHRHQLWPRRHRLQDKRGHCGDRGGPLGSLQQPAPDHGAGGRHQDKRLQPVAE